MLNWLRRLFARQSSPSSSPEISTFTTDSFKDLDKWSLENWKKVPQKDRDACIRLIHSYVDDDVLSVWKEQYKLGLDIGGDYFHFGGGMALRNLLRGVIKDDELPGVFYEQYNDTMYNWDDYYMGALIDALEKWNDPQATV